MVLSHSISRLNLETTSQVTSSSRLITTISLIISWFPRCVLQGDLYVPQKCYQHPACVLSDCISFLLMERRQPAYGGDTANCRPCVLWRSAWVPAPFFYFALALWNKMSRSQTDWCFLLEGLLLIGGSLGLVGSEYQRFSLTHTRTHTYTIMHTHMHTHTITDTLLLVHYMTPTLIISHPPSLSVSTSLLFLTIFLSSLVTCTNVQFAHKSSLFCSVHHITGRNLHAGWTHCGNLPGLYSTALLVLSCEECLWFIIWNVAQPHAQHHSDKLYGFQTAPEDGQASAFRTHVSHQSIN